MRCLLILSSLFASFLAQPVLSKQRNLIDTIRHEKGHYSIGHYKNGLQHGKWRRYNQHGHLIEETKYKAGVVVLRLRYVDGHLTEIINRKGKVTRTRNCGC